MIDKEKTWHIDIYYTGCPLRYGKDEKLCEYIEKECTYNNCPFKIVKENLHEECINCLKLQKTIDILKKIVKPRKISKEEKERKMKQFEVDEKDITKEIKQFRSKKLEERMDKIVKEVDEK